ncbi:MAG: bifunctional oligoribonuclease/PAP phosphatase NrnA [Flavobacteriaceae bacterium]|nr:bifunctional oligoribonuclease/PAP phosphatase NrnA [Flavobacteriaceae bacterium]
MKNIDITEIKQLLTKPKRIVIVTHKNPDGDAIGSSLGLSHYLKSKDHDVIAITPNDYPDFLKWIPGEDTIIKHESETVTANALIESAELIFTLDFNALNRTGNMEPHLIAAKGIKIMIDHHQQPEDYAKYVYSDISICSTSQMIYHFLEMLDDVNAIESAIATCLYVGIMTDTGSFRFASTTSTTHRVIADLIDKGANNAQIHSNVYDTNTFSRLQLLGRSLNNLRVIPELKTAYITLSQEELNQYNFKKGDTEGVVNYALSLNNINFAAIFIEHKQDKIVKISLRSNGSFNVNEFARKNFNGGGHNNAAGGRSQLSLKDTVEKFISILPNYNKDLNL